MDDFPLDVPKAELHLHLEGSVEPETLYELDPSTSIEEYRALYHYTDFDAFLRAFASVGKRLRTPEDYALITRRLLERLEAQNVRYAESVVAPVCSRMSLRSPGRPDCTSTRTPARAWGRNPSGTRSRSAPSASQMD